jgi:hypothetical protein
LWIGPHPVDATHQYRHKFCDDLRIGVCGAQYAAKNKQNIVTV